MRRVKPAEVCLVQLETFRKITLFQCTIQSFLLTLPALSGCLLVTNVHDDGLSPSVMKALVTQTQRKSFFLFSVSLCLRGNFLSRQILVQGCELSQMGARQSLYTMTAVPPPPVIPYTDCAGRDLRPVIKR